MGSRQKVLILVLIVLILVAAGEYPSTRSLGSWIISTFSGSRSSISPTHPNNSTTLFKHYFLKIAYVSSSGSSNTTSIYNASFLPDEAMASVGDNLVINVTNNDSIPHGFTVQGLSPPQIVSPGQTISVTLRNVQIGTYAFYCQLHLYTHSRGRIVIT